MSAIGLALAGLAGARLAKRMGIAVSRSTLLRRVMELADPPPTQPRAVGVDDFALRRGHNYGTVVIDALTHQVLDLLPERDTETLKPWLARHSGIEVICRTGRAPTRTRPAPPPRRPSRSLTASTCGRCAVRR
ncbi:transposase [Streptomyces litchfieldiae]|uniref:Transposase n=1 Tax=Streptomyces litchfieldiae TaxID=3075543 RepID=A0ABU2MPI7_9ACTN|nr:transposase [Streptomyces sp. DSM 44938]MDT0342818.1 transposase [Streptomyces sp. DSM 44938]